MDQVGAKAIFNQLQIIPMKTNNFAKANVNLPPSRGIRLTIS
jgi:hypothetical protein